MTKKILIGAIIFFIIAACTAIYLLFFYHSTPATTAQQATNTTTGYQSFPIATSTTTGSGSTLSTPSITSSTSTAQAVAIQTLTHLYASPIAGATIVSAKGGESVRLTDRATGHMFMISLASSTSGTVTEISDQTIPKMNESDWINASSTILRYLDDSETTIKSYTATLVPPKTTSAATSTGAFSTISGSFLPDNIEQLAINPAGTQIFYLAETATGVTGKTSTPVGSKATTLFTSAITDWNVQWPSATTIALSTKASSVARGYLYFLSTSGTVQRILGDIAGLDTNVNPTATLVAYSDSTPSLSVYNVASGALQSTGLNTLADKCAWSQVQKGVLYCAVPTIIPGGHYPDAWYQGTVVFADSIYRIDTNSNQSTRIATISQQAGQAIDAENLVTSPNDDYLIFTNKADLSLWALQLQPAS